MSEWLGFGFSPERTSHFFAVHLPGGTGARAEVVLMEYFSFLDAVPAWNEDYRLNNNDLKVLLPSDKWKEIADEAKAEFNRRLIRHGVPVGKWPKSGTVPLDRNFGKELALLCWAVEDAEAVLIPNAVRNWLGLSPEERWWLYTMTNAATGHALGGRNKGWRKAVRFALTENPVSANVIRKRNSDFELSLFSE